MKKIIVMLLAVFFISVNAYAYKIPAIVKESEEMFELSAEYTYMFDSNEPACYINKADKRLTLKMFEDIQPYINVGVLKAQKKFLSNNNSYNLDTHKEIVYNGGIEYLLYKKDGYKLFSDVGYTFCTLDIDTYTVNGANYISAIRGKAKVEALNVALGVSKEFKNGIIMYGGANYINLKERYTNDNLDIVESFGGVIIPIKDNVKVGLNVSGFECNMSVTTGLSFNF